MKLRHVGMAVLCLSAVIARADTIIATIPEFNGDYHSPTESYPLPEISVGTFAFTIPSGQVILSAVASGQFGNTQNSTCAGVDLYLDGSIVGQVVKGGPGWSSGPLPWSYSLTAGELAGLMDGSASMTAIQTSEYTIRLGESKLTIETGVVPEPAAFAVLGLGALALIRRRK